MMLSEQILINSGALFVRGALDAAAGGFQVEPALFWITGHNQFVTAGVTRIFVDQALDNFGGGNLVTQTQASRFTRAVTGRAERFFERGAQNIVEKAGFDHHGNKIVVLVRVAVGAAGLYCNFTPSFHLAALLPQGSVGAAVQVVVHDDEVADAVEFGDHLAIIFLRIGGIEVAVGEQGRKLDRGRLNEVDAGRFQRLQEAARQADGDAVPRPESLAPAGGEADRARLAGQMETLQRRR